MKGPAEKILILDRGNVEFAYPHDWSFSPDPAGFAKLEDPKKDCLLEVSYLHLPPLLPEAPDVASRLRHVLDESKEGRGAGITSIDRGDLRLAWADYSFESADRERGGIQRAARGRWLLADNARFQVLMTYYYWVDDAGWAVPAWERIVATLRLGFGEQLADPRDHWSLRDPE